MNWSRAGLLRSPFLIAWLSTIIAAIAAAFLVMESPEKPTSLNSLVQVSLVIYLSWGWWFACIQKFHYPHQMTTDEQIAFQWLMTLFLAVQSAQAAFFSRPNEGLARGQALIVLVIGFGWGVSIWRLSRSSTKASDMETNPFDD